MLYYAVMKQGSQGEIIFKNAQLELAKEAVKTAINELRQKWNVPTNGFQKSSDYRNWFASLVKKKVLTTRLSPSLYSNFLEDISNTILPLIKKPRYWTYFFALYVTKGTIIDKIIMRSGNIPTLPSIKVVSRDNKSLLILKLRANTTLNDVRRIWRKVRALQKSLPDYESSRARRKLLQDLSLLEEVSNGGNVKKIYSHQSIPDDAENIRTPEASHKALQRLKKAIKGH